MKTKRIVRISYFTLLIIVGALIRIPTPLMFITMQVASVLLSGLILGGRDGAISCIIYMLLGLVGLPVFSGGGGVGYVLTPSFGYIIGFIFCSYVFGKLAFRSKTISMPKLFYCGLISLFILYAIAVPYQLVILITVNGLSMTAAVSSLVLVPMFFVVDIVKLLIVVVIYPRLKSTLQLGSTESSSVTSEVASSSPQ